MNENKFVPEQEHGPEVVEKGELVERLRAEGLTKENKKLVLAWTEQEEKKVEAEGSSEASVRFNMSRADLWVAIGDIDGALEALEDARQQAHQEYLDDLVSEIEAAMDKIEAR